MLDIENIRLTFLKGTPNEHVALDNLSLHLNEGEFVTVVGSNGAGKSTLFNAVCGTFMPDSGKIALDGVNITYMQDYKRAKMIGRVFQDPMKGTAPDLTIEENLALAYSRNKKRALSIALNKRDVSMFREALAEMGMGLENRMRTKVGLLSGGQRQVVTLLMCTLVQPKLLLLDEHTAALDPQTSEKIMKLTNEIVDKGNLTTLMITHNLTSALRTGTRTIMMDSGKIILDVSGQQRDKMSLQDLLDMYSAKRKKIFDNDRMLLSKEQ